MKILVTSALPYVNNDLHLGHMIGSVLPADVFARYARLCNHDVLYICGNDEYGTATEISALKEHITPKELCDKYHKIHKKVIKWFEISTDRFGRTTNKEHISTVQEIFLALYKKGYVVEKEIEQPIDPDTGIALADRYIEGTCPYCGYEYARGDQCENCGKLLTPQELINPKSKISGKPPIFKSNKHLFLDLPALQDKINDWQKERIQNWNHVAASITQNWMKEPLKLRDITRNIKWGVPVPLEKYKDLVIYVWFDAPIGYISITKMHTEKWKEWWMPENDNDVKYYQFMGKDNVPFHSVIFPGMLLGDGRQWKTVDVIHAMEYLNYEGKKFSKSKGTGIFCTQAMEYPYPADYWRFYLFLVAPDKSDTNFKWDEFVERVNKELIDNTGNLVRRLSTMVNRFGKVKPDKDENIIKEIDDFVDEYKKEMDNLNFRKALTLTLDLSAKVNAYFQSSAPWTKLKTNTDECNKIFYTIGYAVQRIATMLYPFTPKISEKVVKEFGMKLGFDDVGGFEVTDVNFMLKKMGQHVEKGIILRVGKIIKIEKNPNAEKLYVETVDIGNKNVTIVSGLVDYYSKEELLGKKIILVENLKPAKLRGVKSEGMLLAAEAGDTVEVLEPDAEVGDKILLQHDTNKDIITIDDLLSHKWEVKDNKVYFDDKELIIGGKPVKTKKVKNGVVR